MVYTVFAPYWMCQKVPKNISKIQIFSKKKSQEQKHAKKYKKCQGAKMPKFPKCQNGALAKVKARFFQIPSAKIKEGK